MSRDSAIAASHELVLATRNAGKVRELEPLVREFGLHAMSLDDAGVSVHADEDTLEVFDTFRENALAKAQYYFARSGGRAVLAEDSGLCVDALGGAPGVHSKRWSASTRPDGVPLDTHNVSHLVHVMREQAHRSARFVCVAALVWPSGTLVGEGNTEGEILRVPSGASGFGYDPVFWSTELQAGFGEVSREEKQRVSHRARAVRAVLRAFFDRA